MLQERTHANARILETRLWLDFGTKAAEAASATINAERDDLKQKSVLPRFSCFARKA